MNLSEEHEAPKQSDYISLYDSIVDRKPVKHGTDVGLSGEEYIVSLGEDKVFALAPAAYYIWNLCDGLRSVGDILEKVKSDLKESGEEGLEEVELKQILAMVLSELNSVGLISWT
ncbi:MAG: PqqD family protein [Sulfolobales archaeon]